MRTISCKLEDLKNMVLHIGYEGENDYTSVRIDAGSVFAQYPEAVPSMKVQPPKGNMYPVIVTRDGDIVIWNVSDSDTASNGNGEIQLTFTENTVVVKSCTGKTLVHRSLKATGPAPDPLIDFIDMAEEVVGEAQDAAEAAEAAAQHAPMIGLDGYWYKWDAETEGYVKTDTKARGEDGANGVGITSVEKISTVGLVDTYRINFTNGTNTTYTVTNGQDGSVPIDDTTPAANKVFSSAKVDEELTDVKTAIQGKQDAPEQAGTAGQVLSLDSNLKPKWKTQSGGGGDTTQIENEAKGAITGNCFFVEGFTLSSSGKWSEGNHSFYLFPVNPNDDITVKCNAYATKYTFFTDYEAPVTGNTPDYATGYSQLESTGVMFTVTAPSDAHYFLVVKQDNSNNIFPVSIKNGDYDYLLSNIERSYNSALRFLHINSYPTNEYIDVNGNHTAGGTWGTSDFYPAEFISEIYLKAYQLVSTIALASFYDINKGFVYAIDSFIGETGSGIKTGYLNISNIPSSAKYVRFTVNDTANSFAIIKYDVTKMVMENNMMAKEAKVNVISNYVDITSYNSNGYIDMSGKIVSGENWVYTDFLNAKNVEFIQAKAYQIPGTVALAAFYDNEKNFISAVDTFSGQTGSGNKEGTIPVSSIPNNAVYMRFSGYASTADKYVRIKYNYSNILAETTKALPDIKNDIIELKAETDNLYGYPFAMAFIGDSLTYGQTYVDEWGEPNFAYKNKANYPDAFCRMMGIDTKTVIALPGGKPKDLWNGDQTNIENIQNQFVIVWLGTNGGLTDTVSVDCVGDDITQYANTETGYYGRIIKTLLTNGNKVFLAQVCYTNVVDVANKTIASLADRFSCGLIALSSSDIEDFNQNKYHTAYNGFVNSVHFNSIGYNHVASVFYKKMMQIVFANPAGYEIEMVDTQ